VEYYAGETGLPALSVSLYERPYEKDDAEEDAWLRAMKDAASAALGIAPQDIFLRERRRLRGRDSGGVQYEKQAAKGAGRIIGEAVSGGKTLRYKVNLSDYLDTGFYPDRRLFRALLYRECAERAAAGQPPALLNLFCYTGSLSVAAAAGGAAVDSVDLSNTYLDWAKENFALNGLETGGVHRFKRADALLFVDDALRGGKRWDIIILDPPAFSNSKKMNEDFDLKRDHAALINKALRLLSRNATPGGATSGNLATGGVLYFSANVKGFKLDEKSIAAPGKVMIEDITEKMRDEDYKDKRIPSTWRIRAN
jgi:23S rRNA G2069 N7-methylase RlmK/C1962 C5-methylase RlmI